MFKPKQSFFLSFWPLQFRDLLCAAQQYTKNSKIPSLVSNSIKAGSEIYCVLRSSMQKAVELLHKSGGGR
jgi:hypothetical protein